MFDDTGTSVTFPNVGKHVSVKSFSIGFIVTLGIIVLILCTCACLKRMKNRGRVNSSAQADLSTFERARNADGRRVRGREAVISHGDSYPLDLEDGPPPYTSSSGPESRSDLSRVASEVLRLNTADITEAEIAQARTVLFNLDDPERWAVVAPPSHRLHSTSEEAAIDITDLTASGAEDGLSATSRDASEKRPQ